MHSAIPNGSNLLLKRLGNIMLEQYLKNRLKEKKILLMTHIVLGYPSFEEGYQMVESMVESGVDLMELQIPFSEPIADGPVILRANQTSLANGVTVKKCLEFAGNVAKKFPIPFLLMTYYNILFQCGLDRFAATMAKNNIHGSIVPDLPPEEGKEYLEAMEAHERCPIFIFSPTTPLERMKYIASHGKGFIYCVARKGVTGANTNFSSDLQSYLERCRQATPLPIALGFGVKDKNDVDFLTGQVDIAVIGTQTIRLVENDGVGAVGPFISSLR
jgi:tryptophan synthase alpha chain